MFRCALGSWHSILFLFGDNAESKGRFFCSLHVACCWIGAIINKLFGWLCRNISFADRWGKTVTTAREPACLKSQSLLSGLTKMWSLRAGISVRDYQITAFALTEFRARYVVLVLIGRIHSEVVFKSFDTPMFLRGTLTACTNTSFSLVNVTG